MKYLITIATLFVIGSLSGYILELFYRRFVSQKRWVNPGFMVGPYIPLYGFGTVILYGVSNISLSFLNVPKYVEVIIIVVTIGILMTLIELIAGLIFIKGMHIKLWDYSDRWGNFKGIICPLFSLIWFVLGIGYFYLLNPLLVNAISWINENLIYTFFIGGVVGAMIVDCAYSLHLGLRIKEASGKAIVKYDSFKVYLRDLQKDAKEKTKSFGTLILSKFDIFELKDTIINFTAKLPKQTKWWKKDKNKNTDN